MARRSSLADVGADSATSAGHDTERSSFSLSAEDSKTAPIFSKSLINLILDAVDVLENADDAKS